MKKLISLIVGLAAAVLLVLAYRYFFVIPRGGSCAAVVGNSIYQNPLTGEQKLFTDGVCGAPRGWRYAGENGRQD